MIAGKHYQMGLMHVKLLFVFLLVLYHLGCHRIFLQLKNDEIKFSSMKLRIWNEISTLLLFAIVFVVVLKSVSDWLYGVVGLILLAALLMVGIKMHKKNRANTEEK